MMIGFLILASTVTVNVEQDVEEPSVPQQEYGYPGLIYPGYYASPDEWVLRERRGRVGDYGRFNPRYPLNLHRTERLYDPDIEPRSRLQEERL